MTERTRGEGMPFNRGGAPVEDTEKVLASVTPINRVERKQKEREAELKGKQELAKVAERNRFFAEKVTRRELLTETQKLFGMSVQLNQKTAEMGTYMEALRRTIQQTADPDFGKRFQTNLQLISEWSAFLRAIEDGNWTLRDVEEQIRAWNTAQPELEVHAGMLNPQWLIQKVQKDIDFTRDEKLTLLEYLKVPVEFIPNMLGEAQDAPAALNIDEEVSVIEAAFFPDDSVGKFEDVLRTLTEEPAAGFKALTSPAEPSVAVFEGDPGDETA